MCFMSPSRACVRCGHDLAAGARFCSNCGYPTQDSTESDELIHRRLSASVPSGLAEKIRTSVLKGERRPVTALFADVVGSTAILERVDAEEWTELLNQAFTVMAEAVYRYEGTIAHLLGDGLLAFFGSPVAHEDDPERAVRAALDMLDSLRPFSARVEREAGMEFRIRVGVNSGTVIVRDIGSDLRYEYTAIGDAVNVAARLQAEAAPGTVLVASPTHRFIAPKFETRYVGPLSLKGKAEPVAAHEVLRLKGIPGPTRGLPGLRSRLIGRESPLAELRSMLGGVAASRQGAVALILGEPGIGKSRLISELRLRAAEEGSFSWAEGRCLSFGRGMPYHLLLDLLRSLLEVTATSDTEELQSALEQRMPEVDAAKRSEVRTYLARLLGLPISARELAALGPLSETGRHEGLVKSLNTFLSSIGRERALVLVCEDVHWADRSSIDVLRSMMATVAELPALLILTSRPEPDSPVGEPAAAASAALGSRFREIWLAPLSQEESRSMVAQLLEIESLPSATRTLILEKSEGNPLFVEEVIRMLMEQQAIVRVENKWISNREFMWRELPTTLNGLLLARVDRLSEDSKRLARVASVIGRRFDDSILSEVLKATNGFVNVESGLRELVSFDLVLPPEPGEGLYSFRHALIEEAVYESILLRDRVRLHAAVGDALEGSYRAGLDEWASVIALHLERAGDLRRSADYLVRAGANALQRFAPREAAEFFGRAVRHLSTFGDDAEVLSKRVEAGLGWIEAGTTFVPGNEQLQQLASLLPYAERLGDLESLARIHLAIAEIRHELGEIPDVSPPLARSLEEAEKIAGILDDDRLKALPVALRGFSHFAASDFREAITALRVAVPLLERHATLTKAAYYAGMLAIAAARLGEFDLADEWLARADDLGQRSQDPGARMDVDLHRGIVESERGNWAQALMYARRGTEIAELIDNKACALVGYFLMGDQQLKMGLAQDALQSLQRSTEIAEFCNVADIENRSRAWLAAVRAQLGDQNEALPRLADSLERARRMGDRLGEGEILRQRAIVRARIESEQEAVHADFENAIAIFERMEARPYIARALRDYGLTLQAMGRIGEGQRKLREAFDLFQSMRMYVAADLPVSTPE